MDVGASDHLPILFFMEGRRSQDVAIRRRRFLFEPAWVHEGTCEEEIQKEWCVIATEGSITEKFKRIGTRLQQWNRDNLGNIPKKVRCLREELERLKFDDSQVHVQARREVVKAELAKYTQYEEELWAQRSRVTWMKAGDANTKFFHNFAKARGWRNKIYGISDLHGQWHEDINGVQTTFVQYFQHLFTTEGCSNIDLILPSVIPKVTAQMNEMLLAPFTRVDIDWTLKQMAPNKAPGYDGLSVLFFQKYWHIVGDEVAGLCLRVLNDGAGLHDINHTLIALIPKVKHPQQVTEFRPISLCTVVYKLISKTMVIRMKRVLPDIISPFQSAFVPGRHIHDNIITAFEIVHSIRARHSVDDPRLVLKLDISKAYDRVE